MNALNVFEFVFLLYLSRLEGRGMFCVIFLLCCLLAHVFIKLGYWYWGSVSFLLLP